MKKAIIILAVIVVIIAAAGAVFLGLIPTAENISEAGKQNEIFVSNVGEMVNGFSFTANRYSGVVETQEIVKIDADSEKKVKTTFVKEGDSIKPGDKLFEYDVEDMQLQLEEKKLDVAQTNTEIKAYNDQIDALEKEKKNITAKNKQLTITNQIDAAKLEVQKAEYSKASLEKQIAKLEKSIQNSVVISNVTGTIQSVDDPAADCYIAVSSSADLRIKAMVSEENVAEISEGDSMLIRSRLNEELTWTGKVTSIDTAKPSGGTTAMGGDTTTKYPVYISLDDSDGLMIGQHVTAELNLNDESGSSDALMMPDMYIIDVDSKPYIWAESGDSTVEKRYVELGDYDEELMEYEIKSGITEEDFIAFPEDRIVEGMPTTHMANDMMQDAGMDGMGDEMMNDGVAAE